MAFPINAPFVYVDPPQFLKCVICTEVMKNPVSLSCGHSFCTACCQRAIANKKACPVCRQEVLSAPHPNIALCQALDEQLVYCRFGAHGTDWASQQVYEVDSPGCTKVMRRFETPSHEKECPYGWVACSLVDATTGSICKTLCRKLDYARHQQECDHRLVACTNEGCDERVSLRSLDKHYETCLFETIQCTNEGCSELLKRHDMNAHSMSCPYRVLACPYHTCGCPQKGNKQQIEEHIKLATTEHLMLLANAIDLLPQKQVSERRAVCPTKRFKCIVHNFDHLAKKQVVDIDLDPSWKLKVWPNGEDKRHKGYISIRLFSREASPRFKVEGPYTLRIVNQLDYSKSILKMTEASSRSWADSVRGWGFPAFVKVEDVLDSELGYLKDNKLLVEVEVVVNSIIQIVEHNEPEDQSDTAAEM